MKQVALACGALVPSWKIVYNASDLEAFDEIPLTSEALPLHLEQNGEKNGEEIDEKSVNGENLSKEWFCPVYGWKLWINKDSGGP